MFSIWAIFFTSLPLVHSLLKHNTYACGTVRSNRIGLLCKFRDPKCVKKLRDILRLRNDDVQGIAWYDRRKVTLISSAHDATDGEVRRRFGTNVYSHPKTIAEYSENYAGVDKNDQLRSYYGISNKTVKWWNYVSRFCLDVSMKNAYILYAKAQGGSRKKPHSHLEFNVSLMKGLAAGFSCRRRIGRPPKRPAGHEISKITTRRGQRDCVHCKALNVKTKSGKSVQTTFMCLSCNKGLSKSCFEPYHTNNHM